MPEIEVHNAQRSVSISISALQNFAESALAVAWPRKRAGADIASAQVLLVSIVSDKHMADLHKQFCGIAGPTDVLTFQHGEIVISAQTARRQAREYHTSTKHELRLYILHGLLHLCGYDDTNPRARSSMGRLQRSLFQRTLEPNIRQV